MICSSLDGSNMSTGKTPIYTYNHMGVFSGSFPGSHPPPQMSPFLL